MKFTKDEAYKELVARMTAKGEKLNLSERTMKRQLETLIKHVANDEMELNDFVKEVLDDFKELDGQYRKDNSDFIKEWEKTHPQNEPKSKEEPKPNEGDDAMAKLLARIDELEKKDADREREKTLSKTKGELKKSLKAKGIKNDEWIDLMLQKVNVSEDFDMDAETEYYLKLYNKSEAETGGAYPPKPASNGGSGNNNNPFAVASEMAKRRNEAFESVEK